jgi:hypothetical protein
VLPATAAPVPVEPVTATTTRVTLRWKAATDEEGIAGYRLYRDGKLRAIAGKRARQATFQMPCGRHIFAIEAVDTKGQRSERRSIVLRRRCQ